MRSLQRKEYKADPQKVLIKLDNSSAAAELSSLGYDAQAQLYVSIARNALFKKP